MSKQQSYRHHYVPQWYQRGFLVEGSTVFKILDMRPEVFRDDKGAIVGKGRQILTKGPDAWFFERNLYTTRVLGKPNDDIERLLFGEIDRTGKEAIKALAENDLEKIHFTYTQVFEFLDALRLRTPKGLRFLRATFQARNQQELMVRMQEVRRMHCVMWMEGAIEIFEATHSTTKFIFSDHPVIFFNSHVFPKDPKIPEGLDAPQHWLGTQTLLPLDGDRLMVITHREWGRKQGETRARKSRTNARLFGNPMITYDGIQRGRQLSEKQVREVNYIVKMRAERYIASCTEEHLFPERHLKTTLWSRLGNFLLPRGYATALQVGFMTMKMQDGTYYFQDEFGRRPNNKAEFDKAVKNAKDMEAMLRRVLTERFNENE
ncbi:DUF4238 domain-containing protein [Pseudomonas sp. PDM03]|uniref:DUF4238 domain-containing protein n=1 Tax=Pseudomonas sp. PDM03 TaxID=2769266 RepID=UPI0017855CB7|nr:DUF4238 domain-containing protein [Pseudomonas sp. PDM03]MBD9588963.1 DUF4238 domain-containing protein [Pseudomonas sp. PDM03]